MSTIVFLEVDPEDRSLIAARYPDARIVESAPDEKKMIELCRDAEVISGFIYSAFPKAVIDRLPSLKLLCTRSVGVNHIDIESCLARGITVCNVPDYGSHVIAEHVFALLLSTLRHIPEADHRVERGTFDYHGLRGVALRGKTIGIVGTGKIGRRVAAIARGFGMRILAVDRCRVLDLESDLGVTYTDLPTLLEESDIISLHVPAVTETHHMIGHDAFMHMKQGVILVNTARGELIDSSALLDALKSGKVRYALLDVLEHEQNFMENAALLSHPSVVSTPHIAFYAEESMHNMYDDVFHSIDQWKSGQQPDHVVHPPKIVCDLPGVRR